MYMVYMINQYMYMLYRINQYMYMVHMTNQYMYMVNMMSHYIVKHLFRFERQFITDFKWPTWLNTMNLERIN